MTDLKIIIDAMLPGDSELEMPSASEIDFSLYLKQHRLENIAVEFIKILNEVCKDEYAKAFIELGASQKLQAINACRLVNVRVFSAMVNHLLKAYYTAPCVLTKIGAGSVPPFPGGNAMSQDDWTILEPVFERGQVYREVL
jgi:hypothetical protein